MLCSNEKCCLGNENTPPEIPLSDLPVGIASNAKHLRCAKVATLLILLKCFAGRWRSENESISKFSSWASTNSVARFPQCEMLTKPHWRKEDDFAVALGHSGVPGVSGRCKGGFVALLAVGWRCFIGVHRLRASPGLLRACSLGLLLGSFISLDSQRVRLLKLPLCRFCTL